MRPLIRIFSRILFRLSLVSVFTVFSIAGFSQMSGNYLVDQDDVSGLPGIFNSWQEAADSLVLHGISADVTVNFKTGDYDRNVTLLPIPGTGPTSGVVFQSETGDSNDVRFKFAGYDTANYIVNIKGASYITIQNMQFNTTLGSSGKARVIILNNACHHVIVRNNLFFSIDSWAGGGEAISTYGNNVSHIYIDNNMISKGEVAISMNGKDGEYLSEIHITNNTAENARVKGMSFSYIDGLELSSNSIKIDIWEDRNGIYLLYCTGALRVMGNKIDIWQPGNGGAIFMDRCLGDPTGPGRGLLANNTIRANMKDADTEAWEIRSSENQRIYHNTIRVRGNTQIWSAGLRMDNTDYHSMSGIDIQNNIFINVARGYAADITSKGYVSNLSNNNYFTTGNPFIRFGGSYPFTIEEHIAANGEPGALSVNPVMGDVDLHSSSIWLDSAGADLSAEVTVDIDGVPRTSTPSIGANQHTGVGEPMAGDYYVGGTGADFTGFDEAVNALEVYGISTAVTLNLRDAAAFEERSSMVAIPGAGPDKRVIIQSDPANSAKALISYAGTSDNDYTFQFVRAHYITLKNLTLAAGNQTYGTILRFIGYCASDSIVDCQFEGAGRSSSDELVVSKEQKLEDVHFVGNAFNNGTKGVYIDSYQYGFCRNISFIGNTFTNQYTTGINFLEWLKPMRIEGNYFQTDPGAYNYQAINLNASDEQFQIIGNTIINNSGRYGGIYIGDCDATPSFPNQIINNFITVGGTTSEATGIFTQGAAYIDIIHNNINILASNTHAETAAFRDENGTSIRLLNNNITNFGYGFAIKTNNASAIVESDYNNLFVVDRFLTKMNGDNPSLSVHQNRNGSKDANSISMNPNYLTSSDLHTNSSFIDGKGNKGTTGVLFDIDGNPRSDPPDIGAHEFTASRSPIPAGEYTIGAGGDYTKVKEAFDSLQFRGIAGPVTMKIKPGTYNEYIGAILEIPGTSSEDTIVITSESGDPANTIIGYSTSASQSAMIYFRGTDNLSIKDLTIAAQGTSEGRAILVRGTASGLKFIHNRLTSSNSNRALFWVNDAIANSMQIVDNYFEGGTTAINFTGYQYWFPWNALISGNYIFNPVEYGIYVKYVAHPKVVGNEIINQGNNSWRGIVMDWCNGRLVVSGNKIDSRGSDKGIYLYECESSTPDYGLITNNQIHIDAGTSTAYGIHIHYCDRQYLYHNSINLSKSSAGNGRGIYIQDNNRYLNIMNNVVHGGPSGYAYWVNDPTDIDTSDFNNFFTEGGTLANWGGARADLLALQTASGKDANSISVDPLFYSDADLHSKQPDMYKAGTGRVDVPFDADSVARDPGKPDPGAFQFVCGPAEFNIYVLTGCFGEPTMIIDSSRNISPGSKREWYLSGGVIPDLSTYNDYDTILWTFPTPGMHNIGYSVRQIAGCNDYEQTPIEVPELPELEFVTQGAYCDTDDGEAEVTVTNIPGPFTYNWHHRDEDVNKLTGLALGDYTVAVTDARGCTKDSTITIGEALQLTVEVLKESTCGVPDGKAVVFANGGVEPYDYVWNDGTLNDTNSTMRPGTHFVNVTDKNGCASNISVVMPNDGSGPQVDYKNITHIKCYGDRSGVIDIDVSNVTGQYTIQWSNGAETEDIESLAAGIYNVTVTGEDGCQGAGSFQVTQPARIDISSKVVNTSSCVGADGSATAFPSGGTKPYTYQWSSGGNYQIEEGLSAGVYSVTVTDARGCKNVAPVIVQDDGAPIITITDVQGVGCKINNNGSITVVANPFNPFYDYNWSNGQTGPSINGLEAGVYTLTVTDDKGCKALAQAEVIQEPPAMNPICLVTVDPELGLNKIVWEKQVTEDVDHYNVHRESYIKGNYELVGSVPANSSGELVDSIADPSVRSWRYRLSVVDSCGNESELSPYHKTMHLTMNQSTVASEANLIWDPYVGFDFNTYRIFRSPTADVFSQIDSISASDRFTYTDKNAPGGEPVYYIEVQHPKGCQLTDKKASTLNASKSNRKTKLKTTDVENILSVRSFNIYPNPSTGLLNIEMDFEGNEDIRIMVLDISGRLMMDREISNVQGQLYTQMNLSAYESGVYQILVKTGNVLLHRTLILE